MLRSVFVTKHSIPYNNIRATSYLQVKIKDVVHLASEGTQQHQQVPVNVVLEVTTHTFSAKSDLWSYVICATFRPASALCGLRMDITHLI